MKKIVFILMLVTVCFVTKAQGLTGAWETYYSSEKGDKLKSVIIISEKHQVLTTFHAETGEFINTNGGSWQLNGNMMTETIEFSTEKPESVGQKITFEIKLSDNNLQIIGDKHEYNRIDNGTPGKLEGAWLMSGRKRNDQIENRDTSRPRKTMKILSGIRFQWIAYNTETKEFKGTGGGTFTTKNGKYTENIKFFSKDNSRVGASLEFNYELVDGNWHHSGLSSKGQPIYEIWSTRKN